MAGGTSGNCITRQRTWYARNGTKNSQYPTHTVAATTNDLIPDVNVRDGIALDYEIGGLNPMAVKTTADNGVRIVWMPTYLEKGTS